MGGRPNDLMITTFTLDGLERLDGSLGDVTRSVSRSRGWL